MNRVAHCLLLRTLAAGPVSGAQRIRAAGTIPGTPYTGRVVDETTRRAIVAADISSGNRTAPTGAGGFFAVDLPPDRSRV